MAGEAFEAYFYDDTGNSWYARFGFLNTIDPTQMSKMTYVGIECEADFQLTAFGTTEVRYQVHLTKGHDLCIDKGFIEISKRYDREGNLRPRMYWSTMSDIQPAWSYGVAFPAR